MARWSYGNYIDGGWKLHIKKSPAQFLLLNYLSTKPLTTEWYRDGQQRANLCRAGFLKRSKVGRRLHYELTSTGRYFVERNKVALLANFNLSEYVENFTKGNIGKIDQFLMMGELQESKKM